MERLVLIALIGAVVSAQMYTVRREYAILTGGATAVLLLGEALFRFTGISETFSRMCDVYGVSTALLGSALKVLGIAYLTDFGVNISKDAGQQTIAGTLELGGRILILSCALPSVAALIETGASLIREAIP